MSLEQNNIRVRFAPSPTGPLHLGGVRTALYNFLFARKHKGKFILRIEDTDQKRFVEGAEKYILDSLNWCGLNPDEGPGLGGAFGPYRQSERKEMYSSFVQQLIESKHAYYAFDTPEELDAMRAKMKSSGVQSPTYNNITRESMKNSLTLPADETTRLIGSGEKYVVRIKMPRNQEVKFEDAVRGWVSVNTNHIDDKIIYKSDGMPTYHLANVVDDYCMKISHVIRGEEWLPSAPLHIYLYDCFGWLKSAPKFAHLPLILKPDGNGKLSKRDGDRLGFPVFPIEWKSADGEVFPGYREEGFSNEAFVNMLSFLGWNPGTDKEVFNITELITEFSLERVGKSGSKYDYAKTKWFNQQHLRLRSELDLFDMLMEKDNTILNSFSKEYIIQVIALVKERAVFTSDILEEAACFFTDDVKFESLAIEKKWNIDMIPHLNNILDLFASLDGFINEDIEKTFKDYLQLNNLSFGKIMPMLRIAVTGKMAGPSLFLTMELLGLNKVQKRVNHAINSIL